MSKLALSTEGDRYVIVKRRFAAPPESVYRAHTECNLLQKWLLGPEGWSMPVCVCEPRPGGKIRSAPVVAKWEQAFSAYGGKTWETNWYNEFIQDDSCTPAK